MVNLFDNVNGVKQVRSYLALLDGYKKVLEKYKKQVEILSISEEDKMAAVQVALDLTYLKEELDQIKLNQEELSNEIILLNDRMQEITQIQKQSMEKYENVDSLIIEPLKKNMTYNQTSILEQFDEITEVTKKKSGGLKGLMIFSLILNVICIGGVSVIILYILDIIRF